MSQHPAPLEHALEQSWPMDDASTARGVEETPPRELRSDPTTLMKDATDHALRPSPSTDRGVDSPESTPTTSPTEPFRWRIHH